MDVYQFMDIVERRLGGLTQQDRERIIGTLKYAGYYTIEKKSITAALRIASKQLQSIAKQKEAQTIREAAVTADTRLSEFKRIEELNDKGLCPNCKQRMVTGKLREGEEVNFCNACKVTLWKD